MRSNIEMTKMYRSLFALLLVMSVSGSFAQTIPIGFGNYEEYLRRLQLESQTEDYTSFNVRPLEVVDSIFGDYSYTFGLLEEELSKFKTKVSVLAPEFHTEFNSHHPYYSNNGAMVPSKGFKSLTSVGVHIEAPFLSIQLRPELYLSQNKPYEGFPDTLSTRFWDRRYVLYNQADLPEQFGEGNIRDILIGQSHALIYFKGMGLGISTENLWWGPGKRNSLIMSNNSRSFAHLTFRSQKPIQTFIGAFEWNVIGGRLEQSGFIPPQRGDNLDGSRFVNKSDDWRYLSAISLVYSPKWTPGLSFGVNRAIQQYSEFTKDTKSYFPILINLFRKNDPLERDEFRIDQLISTFIRWRWVKAQAEIYFEYGRNDAAFNARDALLSIDHSRAYTAGFSKVFTLDKNAVQVSYEHTQMSQTSGYLIRNALSWYMHAGVRQGYTHRGEVLGSAIGPGSNLDHINVSYLKGINRFGLTIERWVHDNDFHYFAFTDIRDFRRFWVDYTFGADFDLAYKNFMFTGALRYTRSLNYQWELHNSPPGGPYFVNGRDVSNVSGNLKVIYLFSRN